MRDKPTKQEWSEHTNSLRVAWAEHGRCESSGFGNQCHGTMGHDGLHWTAGLLPDGNVLTSAWGPVQ